MARTWQQLLHGMVEEEKPVIDERATALHVISFTRGLMLVYP